MPKERFFFDADFVQNEQISLCDQEFHHLIHVMRVKVGQLVELVNGRGALASAQVKLIEKKQVIVLIENVFKSDPCSSEVILAQSIPRINRLDFILEKGTELGMTEIWLFPTELSDRKELTEHQIERLRTITISAMKQCGRLYLPKIVVKPLLAKWKEPTQRSFFGDLDPDAPLLDFILKKENPKGTLFYIGPESGFTAEEIVLLRHLKATGVKLHSNILRSDTAALTALALLTHNCS